MTSYASDIEDVGEIVATELTKSIRAAKQLQASKVEAALIDYNAARDARHAGLLRLRKLKEQIAELVRDSIRLEDAIEADWRSAERAHLGAVAELMPMGHRGGHRPVEVPSLAAVAESIRSLETGTQSVAE